MSNLDITSTSEYRAIPGFMAYRAGTDGSIWSCWTRTTIKGKRGSRTYLSDAWKRLKPFVDKDGYHAVRLRNNGRYSHKRVHRAVLESFVGPCPQGMTACHNNGIRSDNRLENLRWDTHANNVADKVLHGTAQRGESQWCARLTEDQVLEIRRLRANGMLRKDIAARFGLAWQTVDAIIYRRHWKHI